MKEDIIKKTSAELEKSEALTKTLEEKVTNLDGKNKDNESDIRNLNN